MKTYIARFRPSISPQRKQIKPHPGISLATLKDTTILELNSNDAKAFRLRPDLFSLEEDQQADIRALPEPDTFFFRDPARRVKWDGGPLFRDEYQWHLKNTGATSKVYDAQGNHISEYDEPSNNGIDIGLLDAWNKKSSAWPVIVALIDSGVGLGHPEFSNTLWEGEGGIHGVTIDRGLITSAPPEDSRGHGTNLGGLIAAGGKKIYGTGLGARLMVIKTAFMLSEVIVGIDWALDHGAQVICCAWGFTQSSEALRAAFEEARNRGVICVCAAPNWNQDLEATPDYPSSWKLDNVISVTNSTRLDQRYPVAAWGANTVHLGAPGRLLIVPHLSPDYVYSSGTSCACAVVAGAVALLKAKYPGESHRLIKNRILKTVVPAPSLKETISGGRLSLSAAMDYEHEKPVLAIRRDGGNFIISISGPPGEYVLETTTNLEKPWNVFGTFIKGGWGIEELTWVAGTGDAVLFFRVGYR